MLLSSRQAKDALNEITEIAERLRRAEPELRARAVDSGPDGFPRQSGPGGSSGHGDPTGTIAALRVDHPGIDTLANTHHQVLGLIDHARRLLEQAESLGRQALPPSGNTSLDDGCMSCARIKTWSPISRARRCRWCSDWSYDHAGEDPPIDILRAHHQGRRITTRLAENLTRRRHR